MSSQTHVHEQGVHVPSVDPPASGSSVAGRSLEDIASQVTDLAARVAALEQKVNFALSVAPQPQTAAANQPSAGPATLKDVLPDIKDLSNKVGGLNHLSDIVDNLKPPKQ